MKNFEEEYNVFQDALEIPKPWYVFHNELAKLSSDFFQR